MFVRSLLSKPPPSCAALPNRLAKFYPVFGTSAGQSFQKKPQLSSVVLPEGATLLINMASSPVYKHYLEIQLQRTTLALYVQVVAGRC